MRYWLLGEISERCPVRNFNTSNPRAAKAYDDSYARLRALYQVPCAGGKGSVLELKLDDEPWITDDTWPAAEVVRCRLTTDSDTCRKSLSRTVSLLDCDASVGEELPFKPDYFDVVFLHFTLDGLASHFCASHRQPMTTETWLRRIRKILKPGGLVVGCTANRTSPKSWLGGVSCPPLGVHNAANVLKKCGFCDATVFNLLEDAANPRTIVSVATALSRRGFGRELESSRASLTSIGYLIRRAFVGLALNRFFERTLLFWASKPC